MAFQSAPQCAEAVIRGGVGTVLMANVLNFHFNSGSYDLAALQALADAIDTVVAMDYLPIMHNAVLYTETLVRGLENEIDLTASSTAGSGVGSAGTNELPANVTMCLTLRTGFTGRSARGRFYSLPTVLASLASPQQFSAGFSDALIALVTNIQVAAASEGWTFIILSRFSGGVKRPTAIWNAVTTIEARNRLVDSQRGRLAKNH
jgi:hypothetical protein